MKHWKFIIGFVLVVIPVSITYTCNRTPKDSFKPKLPNERKYGIEISGNPKGYIPKEKYTVTLKSETPSHFIQFFIVVEPANPMFQQGSSVGRLFPFINQDLATFSRECPNAVIETTPVPKRSVSVQWEAPHSDSGCVDIKATVIESSDSWFSDDEDLTKSLCIDQDKNEDIQPRAWSSCEACNEAKYEIAFQGMWSRNTHPKNFPEDMWSTKLGDIVGASHKYEKSFWKYGEYASKGLQILAEEGDTRKLEIELIDMLKRDDVRTIIKARELSHPNITGTSYTVFRADRENHLVSLVSKITPSPDWIVGVSSLELCSNGTWVESIKLNLYPWDVGTDDGLTYDSPNSPAYHKETIRRIKANSPNKEESPFYSEDGTPIKPVAKLHITRQKIYEKLCENEDQNEEKENEESDNCALSEWGSWSSCSTNCFRTRDRKVVNTEYEEICSQKEEITLQETEKCECENEQNDCGDEWGPWSQCSTTCGTGTKERTKVSVNEEAEEEEETCPIKDTVECYNEDCEDGDDTETHFIGPVNSDSYVLTQSPVGAVVDCKTSDWSEWHPCSATIPCSKGHQYKERHIVIHPENGGKPCPPKLRKTKRCKVPCGRRSHSKPRESFEEENNIDCKMGQWSNWSPCSSNCGHAVQQRTREIVRQPKSGGRPCGQRIEEKKCPLPLACADRDGLPFYV